MAGRASIVGAAETSVGMVRDHNEDSHFIDPEAGIFIVCDGMGGHAAGEVASALAVQTIRAQWSADSTQLVADRWLASGTPDAKKQLLATVTAGVAAAHDAIVAEAAEDSGKKGMGTTVVAAIVVGGDIVFAHCGDSRAYLVRDGITVQLTEDHTLLSRLLAAGVDIDAEGDGARFKSMLTNALGIGQECKVSCFVVPVADGDRFLLCSDGITEYLEENEIGEVLTTMPSPARSAQRLVEIALQRGGADNATALVVRVLEAGETARPSEQLRREEQAIVACPLWAKLTPQQRLRALRIALPRDHAMAEKIPAQTLGDRVAWILVEGEVEQDGFLRGPGSLVYPEALLAERPLPDKDGLAVAQSDVRALALRSDDFRELCDDDPELGEHLLSAVATEIARRRPQRRTGKFSIEFENSVTDPGETALAEAAAAVDATGATLKRPAIDLAGDVARADTLERPAIKDEADGVRKPSAAKPPVDAYATTIPPGKLVASPPPAPDAPVDDKPRQPVAATAEGDERKRSSPPPSEKPRSSLIVAPAETAAAVDEALSGLTAEAKAAPTPAPALDVAVTNAPSVRIEPDTRPAKASNPQPATSVQLSDPEIHIEELVESAADGEQDADRPQGEQSEPAVSLSLDDVDDSRPNSEPGAE